ncbi:MAG: efflux RND transporter periplasmic adaptor subunit [Marinicellaceae bacterium]
MSLLITLNVNAQFGGPTVVKVEQVQQVMMAPVRKIPAMVEAKHITTINTEYKGTIINMAEVGSAVKKGETLAELSDTQSRLKTEELKGALKSTQARLDFLQSENTRLTSLVSKNLISNSELEENKSNLIATKNVKIQDESRLKQYLDQVKRLNIKAPFDGIVLAQIGQPGQLLNTGNAVIEFMQDNNLEVVVNVPVKYKDQIKVGATWQIETQDMVLMDAIITGFVRAARGNSRTIEVRMLVNSLELWSGEAVNVLVPTQTKQNVLAVPRDALVIRKEGTYVYTIVENQSNKIDVVTGMAQGDLIQVSGLLTEGENVIVRGNESLRNKQEVKIVK